MHIYLPPEESTDLVFFSSRNFRAHYPQIAEILEEWYDRSADNCDSFINISEIDKYSVTCTVCRYFNVGCDSTDLKGPSIVKLLQAAKQHDSSY